MTIERAIEALSLLKILDAPSLDEAVKMAVAALRAKADTPPNAPLTLEELREMDGEPVWITPGGFWALVIARRGERVRLINHEGEIVWADKEIELVGPVYRHKPEEKNNGITTLR